MHDAADAAPEHRGEGEDQQDAGDRREDVVEPLEEVADLAAEEAAERRRARCRSTVATSAAETPTKTEICVPLIALASTSRPKRSPPSGSVSRLAPLRWSCTAWRALGPLLVARRQRVDVGDVDVGAVGPVDRRCLRPRRGAEEASAARWRRRPRPASRLATRPSAGRAIRSRKQATTTSDTMPTRSRAKRRQAACQTPSERCGALARVDVRRGEDRAHFSTTRGSTSL